MDITLTDVLEHTDLAARLAYPRLTATLTKPTVFDAAPQLAQGLERQLTQMAAVDDSVLKAAQRAGLVVKPLDLTDPDGNYVNAFEQRMYHHERPLPPRPQRPARTGRPPRKPVSLGKPVPTMPVSGLTPGGSCRDASTYPKLAGVRGDEATDQQRRIALAAALNIDNINDLED